MHYGRLYRVLSIAITIRFRLWAMDCFTLVSIFFSGQIPPAITSLFLEG